MKRPSFSRKASEPVLPELVPQSAFCRNLRSELSKSEWDYLRHKVYERAGNRCELCGRPRAVYRKFRICRICFRVLANEGRIPGVRKASW